MLLPVSALIDYNKIQLAPFFSAIINSTIILSAELKLFIGDYPPFS